MMPLRVDPMTWYALIGVALFGLGLHAVMAREHLLRRIVAMNVMGTGAFMTVVALGYRGRDVLADPVPHAIVLTGLVVAVSTTALAVTLACRLAEATGQPESPESDGPAGGGEARDAH
jgi:multicomponent Na+:H+ antiporter subunit C